MTTNEQLHPTCKEGIDYGNHGAKVYVCGVDCPPPIPLVSPSAALGHAIAIAEGEARRQGDLYSLIGKRISAEERIALGQLWVSIARELRERSA
jgi:hypothetical protein